MYGVTGKAGLRWLKSSRSAGCSECVEVASMGVLGAAVRDSKDPDGPRLTVTTPQWRAFVAGIRAGSFDLS